jgi:hypothetical protein
LEFSTVRIQDEERKREGKILTVKAVCDKRKAEEIGDAPEVNDDGLEIAEDVICPDRKLYKG